MRDRVASVIHRVAYSRRLRFRNAWLKLIPAVLIIAAATAEDQPVSPQPDPIGQQKLEPNIVLVFIDDMGWGDLTCFGGPQGETPEVDRLATEGLRFHQFYVNSPICSPSRTAITTGQYPQRWRIGSYLSNRRHNRERGMAQWLDPAAPVLARFLQQAGYATGHFGKWHMGGQRDVDDAPAITSYGFDQSLTNFEGMGAKLLPLTMKPGDQQAGRIWGAAERLGEGFRWMQRSEITGGFVDAAIDFIDESQKAGKPFYVNVWPDDVHSPFWPPVDDWADGKRGLYRAVLRNMDRQLGKLFHRIRSDEQLHHSTLILFCSDNGPEQGAGLAGPFRGFKTHLFEGGIRSPLIVWGPGMVKDPGRINTNSVLAAMDLVPSLLTLTGIDVPEEVSFDGETLLPVLLGEPGSRRSPLMFRRPPDRDSFYGVEDLPDLAIRSGKWKLLCEYDGNDPLLYDLEQDPAETSNLADAHPELVRELSAELIAWHRSLPQDNGAAWRKEKR